MSGSFEIRPRGGDLEGGVSSQRRSVEHHRGGDDTLFDEFNNTLARLEGAGRDRGSTSGLITQIEQLAAVVERQAQELRVARGAAAKLEGPLAAVAAYEDGLKSSIAKTPPAPPKGAGAIEQEFIRINEELLYNRISVDQAVNQFFTEAEETIGR